MKKVRLAVVSGFEKFGTYPSNPTERITRKLSNVQIDGIQIVSAILPNLYDAHVQLLRVVAEAKRRHNVQSDEPVIIISGGLSTSIREISLEAAGWNAIDSKYADAHGDLVQDGRKLDLNGPLGYKTNVDLVELLFALNKIGVPGRISADPGRFTCNSLTYTMSHAISSRELRLLFLFYHSAFTETDGQNEELRTEIAKAGKVLFPDRYLEQGIPALIVALAKQAEAVYGKWPLPIPITELPSERVISHKDEL